MHRGHAFRLACTALYSPREHIGSRVQENRNSDDMLLSQSFRSGYGWMFLTPSCPANHFVASTTPLVHL